MTQSTLSQQKTRRNTETAQRFALRVLPQVCKARNVAVPTVSKIWVTDSADGRKWAITELDTMRIEHRLEAFASNDFVHQLSTAMGGARVITSNSTGFWYGVLLQDKRKRWPKHVGYPADIAPGILPLGLDARGRMRMLHWAKTPHIILVGETGAGKSTYLQVIGANAIKNGYDLLVGDPQGTSLTILEGHPSLLRPVARSADAVDLTLGFALNMMEARLAQFEELNSKLRSKTFVEDIQEYNAVVSASGRMKRIVIIIDEFTALADETGGKKSPLVKKARKLLWQARKVGIHVVLAGQNFNVEYVGHTLSGGVGIAFRVRSATTSRKVTGSLGAATISKNTPGRAVVSEIGRIQTVLFPKEQLLELVQNPAPSLSEQQQDLATECRDENEGRFTVTWVRKQQGLSSRMARAMQAAWIEAGWVAKDAKRDNALCLTPSILALLEAMDAQSLIEITEAGAIASYVLNGPSGKSARLLKEAAGIAGWTVGDVEQIVHAALTIGQSVNAAAEVTVLGRLTEIADVTRVLQYAHSSAREYRNISAD